MLGKKVRDIVTGFSGICTGKASYLTGCDQYCVTAQAADGKTAEAGWFDETRVEVIGDGITLPTRAAAIKPGGPQHGPSPRSG